MRLLVATPTSLGLALVATLLSAIIGYTLGATAAVCCRAPLARSFCGRSTRCSRFPSCWSRFSWRHHRARRAGHRARRRHSGLLRQGARRERAGHVDRRTRIRGGRAVVGVQPRRLVFRYLLPNIGETLALTMTVSISASLLAVSSLSFLGLGIQPPDYDLGRMLTEGVNALYTNPLAALGPARGHRRVRAGVRVRR